MSSGRTLTPRPRPEPSESEQSAPAPRTNEAGSKQGNLQDAFLNLLRKNKTPVTMFLVKGVKLQGIVTWFDNFSILLRRDGQSQLVYKHAISTIMPGAPVDAEQFGNNGGNRKQRLLQDVFLSRVSDAGVQVTMFLVNGVMLQGRIAAPCSWPISMPFRPFSRLVPSASLMMTRWMMKTSLGLTTEFRR